MCFIKILNDVINFRLTYFIFIKLSRSMQEIISQL